MNNDTKNQAGQKPGDVAIGRLGMAIAATHKPNGAKPDEFELVDLANNSLSDERQSEVFEWLLFDEDLDEHYQDLKSALNLVTEPITAGESPTIKPIAGKRTNVTAWLAQHYKSISGGAVAACGLMLAILFIPPSNDTDNTKPGYRSAGTDRSAESDVLSPASAPPVEVYDVIETSATVYEPATDVTSEPLRTAILVAFESYRRDNQLESDFYPDGQVTEFSDADQALFEMADIQLDSLSPGRRPASVEQTAQTPDLNQLTTVELTLRAGLLLAKAGSFCEMGFEEPRLMDELQNTVDVDEDLDNLLRWDGSWDDLCRQRSRLIEKP